MINSVAPEECLRILRQKLETDETFLFAHDSPVNLYLFSVTKKSYRDEVCILRRYYWDAVEWEWVVEVITVDSLASLAESVCSATLSGLTHNTSAEVERVRDKNKNST